MKLEIFSASRLTGAFSRAGCLLAAILASASQADVGPALSGITARASDASTVFWSPAGITRIDRPELVVDTALVAMESHFSVEESNVTPVYDADYDSSFLLVPGLYYAHPLNERWTAGVSLNAPAGFGNEYGKSWSGRYLAEKSELAFLALTGTLGYQLTDQWGEGCEIRDPPAPRRVGEALRAGAGCGEAHAKTRTPEGQAGWVDGAGHRRPAVARVRSARDRDPGPAGTRCCRKGKRAV